MPSRNIIAPMGTLSGLAAIREKFGSINETKNPPMPAMSSHFPVFLSQSLGPRFASPNRMRKYATARYRSGRMKMPKPAYRTPRTMKAVPPFDFRRPSSRLKKTMQPNVDDSSRKDIDAAERTLMKSLKNVIAPHPALRANVHTKSLSPRQWGEGGRRPGEGSSSS